MAKIYASTSSVINCVYTLSIARDSNNNSNIVITASGTIYGNGSSENDNSDLYVHLCYNVSPANTTGTGAPTNRGTRFGDGQKIVTRPLNKNSIPKSGLTFSKSWTITDNAARTFSNCALFLSGSATNQGLAGGVESYMFTGEKLSSKISNQIRYYTETLSITAGYSNVSNPAASSIKFNSSSTTPLIVAPDASITVSWTAGTPGTNNAIKQYEVTLNGTTKTTANTYCDFSNLNLGRGTSYSAIVKAIPTISGYGPSSGETSTNQVKGNTLPTAPTITISQGTTTINNTFYRNKTGTTTIRFTPSATSTDGQTNTYYYATSSTGAKTVFTSSTNFTPNEDTTYHFWSFDGLEYSSDYTTKAITIGANLSAITPMTIDTNSSTITSYSNNGTTYYTGRKHTITTSGGVGNKTYKWYLQYNTTASTSGAITISLNGTTNSNTWTYPGTIGWGKRYRIYCTVSDELGQTDTAYGYTTDSETTWFTIPAAPSFKAEIFNQLGTNVSTMPTVNVTGSKANDFYQTMVTSLTKDTSVTLNFSMTPSASVGWYSGASNTTYRNSGVIPLTITGTSPNTTYTLKITPTSAWGGTIDEKTYTITSTGLPRINSNGTRYSASNINAASPTSIKPFTETGSYNFVFLKGNMVSNNNYATTSSSNTTLWLTYNNKEVQVLKQGDWTTNSTNGYVIVPATRGGATASSGLYDWGTNTLGLNLNGSNVVGLRIKFTDVFGQTHSVDKPNYLTLNFVETPTINFSIRNNSGSSTSGSVVKEENIITYDVTGDIYNTTSATINTYIYEHITTTPPGQAAEGWKKIGSKTFTPSKTSGDSKGTYSQTITYTLTEITQSRYLFFKADIVQNSKTKEADEKTTYYISQRHTIISNFSVNLDYSNQELKYNTVLIDCGAGRINTDSLTEGLTGAKYGLQFSENENFSNIQWLNNSFVLQENEAWLDNDINTSYTKKEAFTFPSGKKFYFVRPVYQTSIDSKTKTSYGLTTILYNLIPTISYRKNQIGINIDGVESEDYSRAIVAIGGATGKDLIELHGLTHIATIDIDSGELKGFIFDGGTWDQS